MWKHKNFINLQLYAGETWVLNETVNGALAKTDISFSLNSLDFTSISASYYRPEMSPIQQLQVYYGNIQIVYDSGSSVTMYGWDDQAYRTITFATAPTGDLLTWLQANGTKQSTPTKLPTPTNVSITGTTVQWDKVANATSYDVLVDGEVWENIAVAQKYTVNVNCGSSCDIYDGDTLLKSGTIAYTAEITSGVLKVIVTSSATIDTISVTGGVTKTSQSGNTILFSVTADGSCTINTIEF